MYILRRRKIMMMNFSIPKITDCIFNTTISVRISDVNYGNHFGHDSLISFLHEARVQFLKEMGYTELDVEGLGILITNLSVNYINEAFYSNNITIKIGLGQRTRTSIQLIYNLMLSEKNIEIATALTTITFYDYKKSKVARIPQKFLASVGLTDSSLDKLSG